MEALILKPKISIQILVGLLLVLTIFVCPLQAQTNAITNEAAVPQAVLIPRPTEADVIKARSSFDAFINSLDAESRQLFESYPDLLTVRPPRINTAIVPNLSRRFVAKHEANKLIAKQGEIDVLFMGDSITDWWRNEQGNYAGKPVFDRYFATMKVANFGIAGDTTQGVLYRLNNGEGEGYRPKAIMLMIGTNNTRLNTGPEIAEGVGAIVLNLQTRFPATKILLLGIFPRSQPNDPVREKIAEINTIISRLDNGKNVFYRDIGNIFLDKDGNIPRDIMTDGLHPTTKGYELWAEAVKEPLNNLLKGG